MFSKGTKIITKENRKLVQTPLVLAAKQEANMPCCFSVYRLKVYIPSILILTTEIQNPKEFEQQHHVHISFTFDELDTFCFYLACMDLMA